MLKNGRSPCFCIPCAASYNFLGTKLFKVSSTIIMNWVKKYAENIEIPAVHGDIKKLEFDEMWHFIDSKKLKNMDY